MSAQPKAVASDVHADHHADEHDHPGWQIYARIAVILTVITGVEVATYYVDALHDYLIWVLAPLTAAKFIIVVAYYMHLKFDHKLLTYVFLAGMIAAGGIMLALLGLFNSLW